MVYFLLLIIVLILSYLMWLLINIKNINSQIDFVVNESSNKELYLSTHNKVLKDLVSKNNDLIIKYKNNSMKRNLEQKELQIMVSNILHDIRTPLTLVSGYAQVLNDELDDKEHKAQVENIISSVDNASNTLEQLYLISRILENKTLEPKDFNASELIKESSLLYYTAFSKRNLKVNIDILDHVYLHSDKKEVSTMIDNLLSNSLNHSITYCDINFKEKDKTIVLSIQNDFENLNIDKEAVFDRFYTTSSNGTGLGLFIVKKIADRLDGKVKHEIVKNEFCVELTFDKYYIKKETL